jgi:isocitrate dehydrogenase kinase/phosphatase
VVVSDDTDINHLYIERRLVPLNLYIKEASDQAARLAVIDYGRAIKDLAATNIFPGDVLLKNFGVTRHGRVVFYDYDELCQITDCKFRKMPQPRSFDDEFEADPWFYVGPMDIFLKSFAPSLACKNRCAVSSSIITATCSKQNFGSACKPGTARVRLWI